MSNKRLRDEFNRVYKKLNIVSQGSAYTLSRVIQLDNRLKILEEMVGIETNTKDWVDKDEKAS